MSIFFGTASAYVDSGYKFTQYDSPKYIPGNYKLIGDSFGLQGFHFMLNDQSEVKEIKAGGSISTIPGITDYMDLWAYIDAGTVMSQTVRICFAANPENETV